MPLTITDDLIISDSTPHTACPVPGQPDTWLVTWLPNRTTSPGGAVTAMMLADAAASDPQPGHRVWPHISGWAAELGLTAPDVLAQEIADDLQTALEQFQAIADKLKQ